MYKLRITLILVVSIVLLGVSTNVSAHSFNWWTFPRKVIVTKTTTISKVHPVNPDYLSYYCATANLHRGDVITIHHSVSHAWIVNKKGFANGLGRAHYYWVNDHTSKTNWVTLYNKNFVIWSKSMPTTKYLRKNSNAWIYSKPGGKRLHHLKNYPRTKWMATKQEKIENGAVYYYVKSQHGKAKGWVWQGNVRHIN
ncbi:hypothetical protein SIN07_00210 [Pediococcus inopinatus]|uniref:Uncharacterized protein n=1 Tax=Pediococcus inopinatus TaxID=114090 RepID=A0ABZ0Q448_9LACO|nr:hypothetical protein [Pediococcus inopinatus]AVL00845.1 hypothetical protein PI20285_09425 [Pediococcus inopinatus]KRN61058.1 hypothetical protein IV83_GL001121 [Pediococcus inopinatus]WPC16843.1 hypothetical protein N6G94_06535 [Pediococcus inopinatus]WPC20038.1 hypothetical protein N6G95_02255 [Pediococcus inopinatus]WPC21740.1 hypothetical protein N6G96_00520 [Pediococcus inopinatus]